MGRLAVVAIGGNSITKAGERGTIPAMCLLVSRALANCSGIVPRCPAFVIELPPTATTASLPI